MSDAPPPPAAGEPALWIKALENVVEALGHTRTSLNSMAANSASLDKTAAQVAETFGKMRGELMGRLDRLQDEQTTIVELLNDSTGPSLLSRVRHLEEEVRELKEAIRKLRGPAGK